MKQLSSMMTGSGLQRLQHAADADAAGEMTVLADLRARADRGPGVDHGAAVDIGAEVHERRHQDDVRRDVGRAAHHRARHGAEARFLETIGVPALELGRHLVPPGRAAGGAGHRRVVAQPERQQHGFLQPLVDGPCAVAAALGDARLAAVEQVERGLDRLAHRAFGGGRDVVALLEGVVDGLGEIGVRHAMSPASVAGRLVGARLRPVKLRPDRRPARHAEPATEVL